MASLALALLGPFQATLDDLQIEGLRSDWRRALLAYLAVESGREHPREQVASLLWPERPDREALSALRYALSNLRGALGDRRSADDRRSAGDRRTASPFLLVTHTSVQFNPDSDHWLDLAEFQELSSRSDVASLEGAASLYRGPFLDGLSVRDSPAFDEWMLLKGEETRRRMLSVLGRLTSLQMPAKGPDRLVQFGARGPLNRLVQDPLDEATLVEFARRNRPERQLLLSCCAHTAPPRLWPPMR